MRTRRVPAATAVLALCAAALLGAAPGCSGGGEPARRVLVLGIDGLDPQLLEGFVAEGELPNFERLMREGDYRPLQTSMPPLSPIAWSTFITGMDPGGHGIYDFVHRDPQTAMPKFAMAEGIEPWWRLPLGRTYCLPFGGGMRNLRKGPAFWQILEENGVPTTVFRMPSNYPPVSSPGRSFSGMGTPDLRGTQGTFSYYTDFPLPNASEVTGGEVYPVEVVDGRVRAFLEGPENPLLCPPGDGAPQRDGGEARELRSDFEVYLDPGEPWARFVVGDSEFILEEGEWSDWVPVTFEMVPLLSSIQGAARFYLKSVRPDFQLYVTPVQIDPAAPAQDISTPDDWSEELFENLGRFYTQELPEDTKALTYDVFTGAEFWEQSQFVYSERSRALDFFLETYEEGMLFFYFSSVDQGCHMLWRYIDPEHPGFVDDPALREGVRTLYREMDDALGRVMDRLRDEDTLVVMSDHGFNPFYWQVNLNTWLLENGYVTLKDPARQGRYPLFVNVDWSRTTAYAVGLNGLYVNLRGRETNGIVPPEEYDALLDRLEAELLAARDPRNGRPVVSLVTRTHRDFHGPWLDVGPDIVVGYAWGYRSSWKSPLGEFPPQVIEDNLDAWSGDHSIDYRVVPGVLLSNRAITLDEPALHDLTVAILDEYGVEKRAEMIGSDCLGEETGMRMARRRAPATSAAGMD